ncbi:DUF4902 domain-containing protein [Aquabacterium sp. A7-Y]|uniref:DUF4902 domain-containing protein n=1 Tax=Aquabacterium sp. A7-Y TaxID=1349605 RepID=UPI00223E159F|nr:DUF4902 domain-containing protein [Aquabacterium sp. A7-Y]MCW7538951.1 DUF4902 domain-containing protein [Aquabacterium sp. A7-Y]
MLSALPRGSPEDGYLRLNWSALREASLVHLFSGLDLEYDPPPRCGEVTGFISGYTEWVSREEPSISLGWDWRLDVETGLPQLAVASVRSNVMLVDDEQADLGVSITMHLLNKRLQLLDWEATVAAALGMRRYG